MKWYGLEVVGLNVFTNGLNHFVWGLEYFYSSENLIKSTTIVEI
jgi:alpha-galactosidase/6-phospho-beta-glucosidase family protein